jgi:perosamine synthetase
MIGAMAELDIEKVVATLCGVLPMENGPCSLHEPEMTDIERDYVVKCLDSGWVSYLGQFVDQAEQRLAEITNARDAVVVVNGTAALHLALLAAGVVSGDEVLMPALTFVATANAVSYCNAMPHFVDCAGDDLAVDAELLDEYLSRIAVRSETGLVNRTTGRRISALIVVHILGIPADMARLNKVAGAWGLPVIEDAAEALGSQYGNLPVGGGNNIATLSFNGNKVVTSGGGGAVLLPDADLGRQVRHIATTAKTPHATQFCHDAIGYNYRMPNLNAALLCAQLDRLDGFLEKKRLLAERYRDAAADLDGLEFLSEPSGRISNYWLNCLLLERSHSNELEPLLERLHQAGILARRLWTPMHWLSIYQDAPRASLPVTEEIFERALCLPSSPFLASRAEAPGPSAR